MNKKDIKNKLFIAIQTQLEPYGFNYKVCSYTFRRQRCGVMDHFSVLLKNDARGYKIQPWIGIRIEKVEHIFHQTSSFGVDGQQDTATMGAPIGVILGGRSAHNCEYVLENENEIPNVTQNIMKIYRDIAIPFYERWSSLKEIDCELNNDPGRRTIYRGIGWMRCSTSIIVAKLVGRPDYDKLVEFYTDVMKNISNGFYLKYFDALLKSLETVDAGSGLNG